MSQEILVEKPSECVWVSETLESCNFLALKEISLKPDADAFLCLLRKLSTPSSLSGLALLIVKIGLASRPCSVGSWRIRRVCLCLNQSAVSFLPSLPPSPKFSFLSSSFIRCCAPISALFHTAWISELRTPQASRHLEGGVLTPPSDLHLALCP